MIERSYASRSLHSKFGLRGLKAFENVDLKVHFRDFYRFFLPLFVFIFALALAIWVSIRPERDTDRSGELPPGHQLVGLLNPSAKTPVFDPAFAVLSPIEMVTAPVVAAFDPPMGSEHAGFTYNAQPFFTTRHLGDDINGIGGKDSDLGDPVFAIADGEVIYTGWPSDGWGNVVTLLHQLSDGRILQSFYGHLDRIGVFVGQTVKRGEQIGDVGSAGGRYYAHLHLELRTSPALDCGAGYADEPLDRLPGELSLVKWRKRPDDQLSDLLSVEPVSDDSSPSLEVETQP